MQFSGFTQFGQFSFSSERSPSEKIYDSLRASLGPAFRSTLDDAETYADAMCLGASQVQIETAGAQNDPARVSYLLPDLEKDYKVFPPYGSTDAARRALLKTRFASRFGATVGVIFDGLASILGDAFIHWRPMSIDMDEVAVSPDPSAAFMPPSTPIKLISVIGSVFPGTQTVQYSRLLDDGNPLLTGNVITMSPDRLGLEEQVTVTATTGAPTFTATFTKAHEPGDIGVTGPFINWTSNARHSLVVVADSVIADAMLIAKINRFMRDTMPAVSTWTICPETSPGFVGPLSVGDPLGFAPLGVTPGEAAIFTEVP